MKLSEFKTLLPNLDKLSFRLEDGTPVPEHFHITEIGSIHKEFIDCGGTIRQEKKINFQLWNADDLDHRLKPQKLENIIQLSERKLGIKDGEIEVEFQAKTIGKYGLEFENDQFILTHLFTDCLAKENCGIPQEKEEIVVGCTPGSGCC